MDDLIVIILTLIFIVAGLYGQVKKQRAIAENKAKIPSAGEDAWNLPEEEWDEPSFTRERAEAREAAPEPERETFFNPENEGERIIARELRTENQTSLTEKTVKKSKFPLRDAVIYSEILNRKYI
jgi:hypothetical protein